jgi:hypothetical protein
MPDRLQANQQLDVNGELIAANGRVRLVMQTDGNLVLYRTDDNAPLWASNTLNMPVAYAIMQDDGNLVCYGADKVPYWASGTNGHPGATVLLQDDGDLVVLSSSNGVLWETHTQQYWGPAELETITMCAEGPIPGGYIKTNTTWDPTKCGNPTAIVGNVWTLTRYLDRPIGSTIDVCADAPVPNGWVVTDTRWDPQACGFPSEIVDNVKQIQRVE